MGSSMEPSWICFLLRSIHATILTPTCTRGDYRGPTVRAL